MLKRLLIALLIVALAMPTAWFGYALFVRGVVQAWLDQRVTEGWTVSYSDLRVDGFPFAFRTNFTDLELGDPAAGWSWSLPAFAFESPVWRPGEVRATWPSTQSIRIEGEVLDVFSSVMTSDLELSPGEAYALERSETAVSDVRIESGAGSTSHLASGQLMMVRLGDAEYDVMFEARGLDPSEPVRGLLDPLGQLPDRIGSLRYEARMSYDRPWNITALEGQPPLVTRIDLTEADAVWGPLRFASAGTLDIGANGVPEGALSVRAENWRAMLDVAVNAGTLPVRMRGTVEGLLGIVAGLSGDPETIDAELRFEDGQSYLGPLPIGPAPQLFIP